MINYSHAYFLNQLKLGSSARRFFFDAHVSTAVKPLVRLLQSLNVIRRFHLVDATTSTYRVFPAYSRYRKQSRGISLYTRTSGRINLSYQAVRLLDRNSPHSHYVLETSVGILSHKDAVKLRIGGSLLMIVH